jgi:hypothetical protein
MRNFEFLGFTIFNFQENFHVWENEKTGQAQERYVFLFKSRIVITSAQPVKHEDELPKFKHIATIRVKFNHFEK